MIRPGREQLSSSVEVSEAFLDDETTGARGRGAEKKVRVAGHPGTGPPRAVARSPHNSRSRPPQVKPQPDTPQLPSGGGLNTNQAPEH